MVSVSRTDALPDRIFGRGSRRRGAGRAALGLAAGALLQASPRAAHAAARASDVYNCVNVVLRDPYWSQFRRIIESGWNAAGVAPALERAGFLVTDAPSIGAIMWWPPNYFGASDVGHVGIVEALRENGSILVRHENWPYGSPEWQQTFPPRTGYRYVHRADAPDGSGEGFSGDRAADAGEPGAA